MVGGEDSTPTVSPRVSTWKFTACLVPVLWCTGFVASVVGGYSESEAVVPATATMLTGTLGWLVYPLLRGSLRPTFGDVFARLNVAVSMNMWFMSPRVKPWGLSQMLAIGIPGVVIMMATLGIVMRLLERRVVVPDSRIRRGKSCFGVFGPQRPLRSSDRGAPSGLERTTRHEHEVAGDQVDRPDAF